MKAQVQTQPLLGSGIYAMSDIALILGIPYRKVSRWVTSFWDDRFGSAYGYSYSWSVDLTKAVNFHTLIELFVFYQLSQAGVTTHELIKAHDILARDHDTSYPFASKTVLEGIRTDGRKVLMELKDGSIHSVDRAKQFKLLFVKDFFKKLDFDSGLLASRYWPLGKEIPIVCDPHHQFGQPVINGTNIQSETLFRMHQANEPAEFIAALYELPLAEVLHAIEFHKNAA